MRLGRGRGAFVAFAAAGGPAVLGVKDMLDCMRGSSAAGFTRPPAWEEGKKHSRLAAAAVPLGSACSNCAAQLQAPVAFAWPMRRPATLLRRSLQRCRCTLGWGGGCNGVRQAATRGRPTSSRTTPQVGGDRWCVRGGVPTWPAPHRRFHPCPCCPQVLYGCLSRLALAGAALCNTWEQRLAHPWTLNNC